MTTTPHHSRHRSHTAHDQPDERLGLALMVAIVALFLLFSFLVA